GRKYIANGGNQYPTNGGDRDIAFRVFHHTCGNGGTFHTDERPQRNVKGTLNCTEGAQAADVPCRHIGFTTEPEPAKYGNPDDGDQRQHGGNCLHTGDHFRTDNVQQDEDPQHHDAGDG